MILVDTRVWIDYFNGRSTALTDCLDQHLEAGVVATGDRIMLVSCRGFDTTGTSRWRAACCVHCRSLSCWGSSR